MKNLTTIAATIFIALFTLTSCEKESMSEITESTSIATTNERNLPAGGIHTVNEASMTEATLENGMAKANSRTRIVELVSCGTSIQGNTFDQNNTFDESNTPCITNYRFDGPDNYFQLKVEADPRVLMTHIIQLNNLKADLDLFLYTLAADFSLLDCKAVSIDPGTDAETIEISGLKAGYYAIIVDGWEQSVTSEYTLSINCAAVSATPPTVNCETFDNYRVGNLCQQSNSWRKKYPNASFDAQVTQQYAVSGRQGMSVKYQNNCQDNHQPSVIYDVAPKTTGHYTMKWNMLVGENTNGAINLQKFNSVNSDESVDIYIRSEGKLAFKLNGKIYGDAAWAKEGKLPKTHVYNQWMTITLDINFHNNLGILSIDNEVIAYWDLDAQEDLPIQGAQSFAGVNFKTYSAKSHFLIDDICTEWTEQDRLKENDPAFYDKLFSDPTILSLE